MNKLCFTFLLYLLSIGLQAQTIYLYFPMHSEKSMNLSVKQGVRTDTIYVGHLDVQGRAEIIIPDIYKNYAGMANIHLQNNQSVDFIVNGESFTISSMAAQIHGGNVLFSDSPENTALQTWFAEYAVGKQKQRLLANLAQVYNRDNAFFSALQAELSVQEAAQHRFEAMLEESPLYAAQFIRIYHLLNGEISNLIYADSLQMAQIRQIILDNLDIQALYTSSLWFNTLNGMLALYGKETPFHDNFIKDMSHLLNRADDNVYTILASNLVEICETMNWSDLEEQLAYFLINDGRIKKPTGKIQQLMTLYKLAKGSKAPSLSQGKLPKSKTLLVFYETGCGNCEVQMQEIKEKYVPLKEMGYEVVSVAADIDLPLFKELSEDFPWKAKYCDGEGFAGKDFQNYGIIGTPTMFVINKKGIIQGRYARLQDLLEVEN